MQVVDTVTIRANYLTIFSQVFNDNGSLFRKVTDNRKTNTNKVKGTLSSGSRKSLGLACEHLLFSARPKRIRNRHTGHVFTHRASAITLTLPSQQIHCDKTIKEVCLNNFLQCLRSQHYMSSYVWRAEVQKNGNLHFHIITPEHIDMDDIRRYWNQSTELLGYCSRYSSDHLRLPPPSTEIKEVKSFRDCARYLRKYMSKGSQGRPICGAQWDASQSNKGYQPASVQIDSRISEELNFLIRSNTKKVIYGDFATTILVDIDELQRKGYHTLSRHFHKAIGTW